MWLAGPFDESAIFSEASPFRPMKTQVERREADDTKSLRAGFESVLRSDEAKQRRRVVFIWTLAASYRHSDGERKRSRIVYVEKTMGSIFSRWPPRYIELLVRGADAEELPALGELRRLANRPGNGLFYRTIIAALGPLQVWWADVERLNEASKQTLSDPRKWEHLILKRYCKHHGCLPLKNRRA
jgi:hypothetical protein